MNGATDSAPSGADYKVQRIKEVAELDDIISVKQDEINDLADKKSDVSGELSDFLFQLEKTEAKLKTVKEKEKFIAKNASHYDDDPKYALPEPKPLMYAKTYHDKFALPLVCRLKNVIRSILLKFIEKTRELQSALDRANTKIQTLSERISRLEPENGRLLGVECDYIRLRRVLGGDRVDELVNMAKELEIEERKPVASRTQEYAR